MAGEDHFREAIWTKRRMWSSKDVSCLQQTALSV